MRRAYFLFNSIFKNHLSCFVTYYLHNATFVIFKVAFISTIVCFDVIKTIFLCLLPALLVTCIFIIKNYIISFLHNIPLVRVAVGLRYYYSSMQYQDLGS